MGSADSWYDPLLFFLQHGKSSSSSVDFIKTNEALRRFIHKLRMKMSDASRLYLIYSKIDKDNSGSIDINEFFAYFQVENTEYNRRAFRLLSFEETSKHLPVSHYELTWEEFFISLINYGTLTHETLVRFAFHMLGGGDAVVDRTDVQHFMRMMYEDATKAELNTQAVMGIVQTDQKGYFGWEDFANVSARLSSILFPAFTLQRKIRGQILSRRFWDSTTRKRKRAFPRLDYGADLITEYEVYREEELERQRGGNRRTSVIKRAVNKRVEAQLKKGGRAGQLEESPAPNKEEEENTADDAGDDGSDGSGDKSRSGSIVGPSAASGSAQKSAERRRSTRRVSTAATTRKRSSLLVTGADPNLHNELKSMANSKERRRSSVKQRVRVAAAATDEGAAADSRRVSSMRPPSASAPLESSLAVSVASPGSSQHSNHPSPAASRRSSQVLDEKRRASRRLSGAQGRGVTLSSPEDKKKGKGEGSDDESLVSGAPASSGSPYRRRSSTRERRVSAAEAPAATPSSPSGHGSPSRRASANGRRRSSQHSKEGGGAAVTGAASGGSIKRKSIFDGLQIKEVQSVAGMGTNGSGGRVQRPSLSGGPYARTSIGGAGDMDKARAQAEGRSDPRAIAKRLREAEQSQPHGEAGG